MHLINMCQRKPPYPTSSSISLLILKSVDFVSGNASLATARAAGADMKEAEITCSAGTCHNCFLLCMTNLLFIKKIDKDVKCQNP